MVSGTQRRTIVPIALIAVSVLPILQAGMVAPILGALADSFHGWSSPALVAQVVLVTPTLAIILAAPWIGRAIDRDARNRLVLVALGFYGAMGAWCIFANDPTAFVLARLVLGVCIATIVAATPVIIARYYAGPERRTFLGVQASAIAIAGAVTPIIAGLIAVIDWRFVFAPYLLAWLIIPAMAVVNRGMPPATTTATLAEMCQIRARDIAPVCLRIFFLWLMLYLLTTQLAFHLRGLQIDSAMAVGIGLGTASTASAVSSLLYATIKPRAWFRQVSGVAFLISALGYLVIAYADDRWLLGVGLVLSGFGFGINIPNAANWLIETVDANVRGRAFGWLTFAMYLGQLLSVLVYSPLVGAIGSAQAFLVVAGVSALIGAVSFVGTPGPVRPAVKVD